MKLSIANIQNQGVRDTEVIMLKVEEDCDLRNYIVTEAQISTEDALTTPFHNTFWFPERAAKKGDYVLLFSRPGASSSKPNDMGSTTHFFYWQSDHPIWKDNEDAAVIFELSSWITQKARAYVSNV